MPNIYGLRRVCIRNSDFMYLCRMYLYDFGRYLINSHLEYVSLDHNFVIIFLKSFYRLCYRHQMNLVLPINVTIRTTMSSCHFLENSHQYCIHLIVKYCEKDAQCKERLLLYFSCLLSISVLRDASGAQRY